MRASSAEETIMHDDTRDRPPLPEGWVWTTIGEVADTTSGGTPSRKHSEYYTDGTIPWVKSGELEDNTIFQVEERITEEALQKSSAKIFPANTPLVALYGATVGRTGILGIDAATNQAVCAIFAWENAFTSKYISYWLRFQRPNLIELSSGGAQPNISQRIVRAFSFPLAPLPEQRRIVDAIETQFTRLDAAVAALERIQAALERYRASVLKAACEGRLVPTEATLTHAEGRDYEPAGALLTRILAERRAHWEVERWQYEIERAKKKAAQAERKAAGLPYHIRDLEPEDWQNIPEAEYADYLPKNDRWKHKYEEPELPDVEGLPELPEGWAIASMDQLSTLITSGPRHWSEYYDKGDGVFLMAQNVRPGELDLSYRQFVDPPQNDSSRERSQVDKGDLLVTIVGANTGDVCQVPRELPNHFVCQSVALMRPVDIALSDFLTLYLVSPENGQRQYRRYIYGAGRPHLKFDELRMTAIVLPPLPEQRRIVAEVERRLSLVEALETAVATNLRRAERLRQSILKRAFEGRLAPQDPGDAPAAALLARVQAGREQAGGQGQRAQKRLPGIEEQAP